jgi:hypothetical protein
MIRSYKIAQLKKVVYREVRGMLAALPTHRMSIPLRVKWATNHLLAPKAVPIVVQ